MDVWVDGWVFGWVDGYFVVCIESGHITVSFSVYLPVSTPVFLSILLSVGYLPVTGCLAQFGVL